MLTTTFPTQQAAERVLGMGPLGRASVFGEGPRHAAKAGGMKALAVVLPKDAEIGRTKAGRLFEHCIEHRGGVARRRVDDLQYLGHRFVAFGRPLIQLALGFVPFCSGLPELASQVGDDVLRIG